MYELRAIPKQSKAAIRKNIRGIHIPTPKANAKPKYSIVRILTSSVSNSYSVISSAVAFISVESGIGTSAIIQYSATDPSAGTTS